MSTFVHFLFCSGSTAVVIDIEVLQLETAATYSSK